MRWRGAFRAAAGEHGGRLHRARVPVRRQADHPRRAGGPLLRQADGPADGLRRLLHQPCRGRPERHGHAADAAGRGGPDLHHGRAGRRRHHAQLPEHVLPRRAVPARRCWGCGARRSSTRWLQRMQLADAQGRVASVPPQPPGCCSNCGSCSSATEARHESRPTPGTICAPTPPPASRSAARGRACRRPSCCASASRMPRRATRCIVQLDTQALADALAADGLPTLQVHSAAVDRASYLLRPDLGRRLDDASAQRLRDAAGREPHGGLRPGGWSSATASRRWRSSATRAPWSPPSAPACPRAGRSARW